MGLLYYHTLQFPQCSFKPLFLHGSMSHSYETVASILGPSTSMIAKADTQPTAVSSPDLKDEAETPSDEFLPSCTDDTFLKEETETQFEDTHVAGYPASAEPYMLDLVSDRSASPSPPPNNDEGIMVCANMKKWPPLTEADISEISKDDGERVEEQEADVEMKEDLFKEQESVWESGDAENVLAELQTEAEQGEVQTITVPLQLDEG